MPLRESHQILLVMLLLWCGIRYVIRPHLLDFGVILLCASILALSHKAFSLIAVALVLLIVVWPFVRGLLMSRLTKEQTLRLLLGAAGVFAFLAVIASVESDGTAPLRILLSGEFEGYVSRYWTLRSKAYSSYQFSFDFSNAMTVALSVSRALISYLFYPFPWLVRVSFADMYAFCEALLRFGLIMSSLMVTVRRRIEFGMVHWLLMSAYFLMAVVWSLGTINYGTALRHNLTHQWIIVLLGSGVYGPLLIEVGESILATLKRVRSQLRSIIGRPSIRQTIQ